MTETTEHLRETALTQVHRELGARLIEFGGWLMPVQYAGILEEHRAVRERAGLFDLSHMGELYVEGDDAGDALAAALVTDPRTLPVGRAHYSMICAADGGIIDDLIVYRLGADRFMVVANAGNALVVSDELAARLERWRAVLDDRSLATSLVAIQGPRSAEILGALTDVELPGLRYYAIAEGQVAGIPALVARTGYTGEDGFELFVDWARGPEVWRVIHDAGRAAGLGRVVKLDKPGDFVGRSALERVERDGIAKRLVGLRVTGRGIARHGYPLDAGERRTGGVTSGTQSPTLGYPIAMAYVAPGDGEPGTMLDVEIRDQRIGAEVVPLPFWDPTKAVPKG